MTTTLDASPPGPARRVRVRRRRRRLVVVALVWAVGTVLGRSPAWPVHLPARVAGAFHADHTFLETDAAGRPVAWDHCRAIHYVVNPQGAPSDWRELVRAATDEITTASGFVLVLDGTTTDRSWTGGRGDGDPVLVGWGVRREVGPIGEGAAGLGAPITFGSTTSTGSGQGAARHHGSGIILFDSLYFGELARHDRRGDEQMIVVHEWLHVLGLGHVQQDDEVMGTSGRRTGGTHLGRGDVAGLAALHAVPCGGGGA